MHEPIAVRVTSR